MRRGHGHRAVLADGAGLMAALPRRRPPDPPQIGKRLTRRLLLLPCMLLVPAGRRRRIERRLRGREEFRKLRLADHVVVSHGKSGRTWLRVLLSRFFQRRFGLDEAVLLGFENLHLRDLCIPRILYTHDDYLRDYTGNLGTKRDIHDKGTVLLVRHPADVAVSQSFQWRHRMRARKKALHGCPRHGAEVGILDFVTGGEAGLPRIIDLMNGWAREPDKVGRRLVLRYEDLHADAAGRLGRVLRFMGEEPGEAELADCAAFARFDNMRRLEVEGAFRREPNRMGARDPGDPASFKVRRGEVGGWRGHFGDAEAAAIERLVEERLLPGFGLLARERPWGGKDDGPTCPG